MRLQLALALVLACGDATSPYTHYPLEDAPNAQYAIARVGDCGDYAPSNGPCNITILAELCDACPACTAFNTNGWLKSCANASCGNALAPNSRVDTYVKNGGVAPNPGPSPWAPVADVEDEHYPSEEVTERAAVDVAPSLVALGDAWAVLAPPGGGASVNVSAGEALGEWVLAGTVPSLPAPGEGGVAVLERSFARWGVVVFVGAAGEVGRLRKGTGAVAGLRMPNYAGLIANESSCGSDYYARVSANASDVIADRIIAESVDGEASFLGAAKFLPPQRDYAIIGGIDSYDKYSVAPDGRIKAADDAIYVPGLAAADAGPGVLVFDPFVHLPKGLVPATNFSVSKSALLGGSLRIVAVTSWEPTTLAGFEQIAFAPSAPVNGSALVRLRAVAGGVDAPPFQYSYFAASRTGVAPLAAADFYAALWVEAALWNSALAAASVINLPGQDGARQVDSARGALIASLSLYVGLQPNYGDGADYWSPQVNRGGSLPFQLIALVQNLLDVNLPEMGAARLGWWQDHYICGAPTSAPLCVGKADGTITTGDWETSCPYAFADGFADLGEMQDVFARTARALLAANAATAASWIAFQVPAAVRLANYSLALRRAAASNSSQTGVIKGLVWGPPEHDTCHDPGFYYHNNAQMVRGMREMGAFLTNVCPTYCPAFAAFGAVLTSEAALFSDDFAASVAATITRLPDGSVFVPPIAALAYAPFESMIESTVAEYSNFRYFAELLGAGILASDVSVGLQRFRESHTGTVSSITRWSDHLDDSTSSHATTLHAARPAALTRNLINARP